MPSQSPPSPLDDLALIRRVVADSRRAAAVDLTPFVGWGLVIVAGAALEYAVRWLRIPVPPLGLWIGVVGAGWAATVVGLRLARPRPVVTLAMRALGAVWLGCIVTATILCFVGHASGYLDGAGIMAAGAATMGVGYCATAALTDQPMVRWLAVAWWAIAILLFLSPGPHPLAILAIAMLLLQVVPGLVLRRRWRHAEAG